MTVYQTSLGALTNQQKQHPYEKGSFRKRKKKKERPSSIGSGLHFKYNTSVTSPQKQSMSQFKLKCV